MNTRANRKIIGRLLPALLLTISSAARAEEVTLVSNGGNVEIVGEIINFDNVTYTLATKIGEINARADGFTCVGDDCPQSTAVPRNSAQVDTVTISGSDTVGERLMGILISGYAGHLNAEEQLDRPDGAIEAVSMFVGEQGFGDDLGSYLVRSSVSSDAFANLLGRSADIGMSSRRIEPAEARALRKYGAGNMIDPTNEHIVAIDSLVVITHPDNPVNELSMDQLRAIYIGEITNWADIGGTDAPINAVQIREGSGTRSVFEDRVFEGNVNGAPAAPVSADGNSQVASIVNEDEHAIGYVSAAFQRRAKPVTLISDCDIPMVPNAFSARTEEYSLGRFLYLYSRGDNTNPDVRSLLNYVTSNDADQVIAKSGFIDLGVSRQSQSNSPRARLLANATVDAFEAQIISDMRADIEVHDRLSATFRFRTGSQTMTPRSLLNIERLIDYLENQPAGTEILVAGFTDSVGAFTSNLALAEGRAAQVMQVLQDTGAGRLDGIRMTSAGYGEIAPVSCNTTDQGRSINRRVEIWIKQDAT